MTNDIIGPKEGFVTYNGFKMHYLEWGRKGKMIVSLHSMRMDAHAFDDFSKSMSKDNRVLAIDLLGHGDSDKPTARISLVQHMEIIRGVVNERNFYDSILIGHSVGGYISMIYASKYPEEISMVILVDIGPRDPSLQRTPRVVPEVFRSKDEAIKYFKESYPNYSQESIENRLKYGIQDSPNGTFRWKANPNSLEMIRKTFINYDFWPRVERIEAPTLLIKGAESETVTNKTLKRMKETIKDFSMIEIKGAGHQIPLDRPKEFEEAVRKFIIKKVN